MSEESKGKVNLTEDQKEVVREIARQAKELGVDVRFAIALANLESSFQHVPADDKSSTAFGPFQVNKATAEANKVDYDAMKADPKLAIRTGLLNIVRHANNPDLGGDPMRIAAAHRYGENSEFAKTGNPQGIDPTLRDYLVNVTSHFPDRTLPEAVFAAPGEQAAPPAAPASAAGDAGDNTAPSPTPRQPLPLPVQSLATGAVGAAVGPVAAVAHPVAAFAIDKVLNRGGDKQLSPDVSSEWRPQTTAQTIQTASDEGLTRGEKQRLSTGDKSGMTGRESQQGYAESTGQQAARRKFQEQTAKQLGLDINRPIAEYPNIASTRSGIDITQEELARQQNEATQKKDLIEARERARAQLAAKNAQRVGADWQRLVAANQLYKPSLALRAKEAVGKAVSSMSPTSKSLPGTLGRAGYGAGAAIPYSVELYRNDHPWLAGALPFVTGLMAEKAPKTFGGLTAAGALLSGAYAAAHPLEYAKQMKTSDIVDPTVSMYMTGQELHEPAIPELQGETRRSGAGRGFVNPALASVR